MNFEDIKKELEEDINKEEVKTPTIDLDRGKNNPVHVIRSNMKKEIITQLIAIVIFMVYPSVVEMPAFSESVYYIFMFITSIMTMAYIIKLSFFLRKTSNFAVNTKDAVKHFIFEAKLTLEVYKSFIIAGSLLLPIPVFALLSVDSTVNGQNLFQKWFTLDISTLELSLLIIGYLLIAVLFYYITVLWAKALYGKYLKELEDIIVDLEE